MMKKILFLLVAASLTLASCIKEDESYKRTLPVQPGINIRNFSAAQNYIAMQPINMAIRLAMLTAEAKKQHKDGDPEPDLTQITIKGENVFKAFYKTKTTLTKLDNGDFQLVFKPETVDAYYPCEGTMTVNTSGVPQLYDTTYDTPWIVTLEDDFSILIGLRSGGYNRVHLAGGQMLLYYNGENGYSLNISGVRANYDKSDIISSWTGEFTLKPDVEGVNLAASDCVGKDFSFTGGASGPSCYTADGTTSLMMVYDVTNLVYKTFSSIKSGVEECALMGSNYDIAKFPAPYVKVEWTYNGGRYNQIVHYNGSTISMIPE